VSSGSGKRKLSSCAATSPFLNRGILQSGRGSLEIPKTEYRCKHKWQEIREEMSKFTVKMAENYRKVGKMEF
jgi:hypothetical protein